MRCLEQEIKNELNTHHKIKMDQRDTQFEYNFWCDTHGEWVTFDGAVEGVRCDIVARNDDECASKT